MAPTASASAQPGSTFAASRPRTGVCGLIVALAATASLVACSRPVPAPEPVRAVRSVVVAPGAASARQDFAAEIRARTESRLGFRVGGKLVERPAQLGDVVRKGQLLARLDPQDLRLIEQAAQAAVQGAQVNASQAEADLKRFKGLFEQGFISAAELERRTTAVTAAVAQLDQAKAQAQAQSRQTVHGSLVADASGVITAVEAEPGAVLAAGAPVLRLAWNGPRDVVFSVPEDRVAALRSLLNQPGALAVQLWGDDKTRHRATLREIAAAADTATRTFLVKAALVEGPQSPLVRLGQTAVVTVEKPAVVAIKLPLTALVQQQGQTSVWVLDTPSMTVKVQPIQVAAADGNEAIIAAGLKPGDEVVVAGVHVLTPGQKVKRESAVVTGSAPGATPAAQR
jgi:membrane fusion protein, multidrug efflux system